MNERFSTVEEHALVEAARQGDLDSFEELVQRYQARLFSFVLRFCGNQSDAAEIVQDTFVRAFHGLDAFKSTRQFSTWLFTIARRRCTDHFRAQQNRTFTELPELAAPESQVPGAGLERRESEAHLWATAQRNLPRLQFEALWLRYREDLEIPDVSRVMNTTQTHVKVLLFRARRTLLRLCPAADHAPGRPSISAVSLAKQQS